MSSNDCGIREYSPMWNTTDGPARPSFAQTLATSTVLAWM